MMKVLSIAVNVVVFIAFLVKIGLNVELVTLVIAKIVHIELIFAPLARKNHVIIVKFHHFVKDVKKLFAQTVKKRMMPICVRHATDAITPSAIVVNVIVTLTLVLVINAIHQYAR